MSITCRVGFDWKRVCRAVVFALPLAEIRGCMFPSLDLRAVTSGRTGCSPENIVISNEHHEMDRWTWTADCNGTATYVAGAEEWPARRNGGEHVRETLRNRARPGIAEPKTVPFSAPSHWLPDRPGVK